jgi:nucleoside-diphosphate-sugar epimerase
MKTVSKILVTGGRGYVGSSLVKELDNRGIEYLAVDKTSAAVKKRQLSIDLRDRAKTLELVTAFKPDMLIQCATHSALAYRDHFVEALRDDVSVTSNILDSLAGLAGCRLVAFSSSYCYSGLPTQLLASEEAPPLQASHNFGIAKLFFEQLLTRVHANTVIFRLSSVFGPGVAPHPNAILALAKECLVSGKLTVWGAGTRMMQYVDIGDAVRYILGAGSVDPGVYNLGGNEYTSVAETATAIANFFGVKVEFLRDKKEGETLPLMDTTKLKRAFGDQITPFAKSLRSYLEFLRATQAAQWV